MDIDELKLAIAYTLTAVPGKMRYFLWKEMG